MSKHTIKLTEGDAQRLRELLACLAVRSGIRREARELLRHKLGRASIVSPREVGRRVVTMQSRVVVKDEETWESRTYTLAHPDHADHDSACLSILTPLGMAILGHQEGDVVDWGVPAGTHRVWIQKVARARCHDSATPQECCPSARLQAPVSTTTGGRRGPPPECGCSR